MPKLKHPSKVRPTRQARYKQRKLANAAEIGDIPDCVDRERREACRDSLQEFCITYFPHLFTRQFTQDEKRAVHNLEVSIKEHGTFAVGWPRGKGKTTLSLVAAIWAALYGWRRFIVLIAATGGKAKQILINYKFQLENNDLLREDFPEICYPVRAIEGKGQRSESQTYQGHYTNIYWKNTGLRFHNWPENEAADAIVLSYGITSGIRGLVDAEGNRPDLFLIDDPQTRESAHSDPQTRAREEIIKGDILGLAGHNKRLAAVMNITYIARGDLTDRFIDHELHPEWKGEKSSLVYRWPDATEKWEKYAELWRQDQINATYEAYKFYEQNRDEMDKGAVLDDEALYDENSELSALQHAYNLYLLHGEATFNAEYQGQPEDDGQGAIYELSRRTVLDNLNGLERGQGHTDEIYQTVGIDINYFGLSWVVMSIQRDIGAHVIDYGFWPGGNEDLWSQEASVTLEKAVYDGLFALVDNLLKRYPGLTTVAIDGNFETGTVYRAARNLNSLKPASILTARGRSAEQYNLPQKRSSLRRVGHRCHLFYGPNGLTLTFDSHYWHRHLQMGFFQNPGAPGSVALFGNEGQKHNVLADHITAEELLSIEEKHGRESYKWYLPSGSCNDLADAAVMALVCAAVEGASPNIEEQEKINQERPAKKGVRRITV